MCIGKIRPLSEIGAKKISFPPKPDRKTDRHTYRRTDICFYRVALLLKISKEQFRSRSKHILPINVFKLLKKVS